MKKGRSWQEEGWRLQVAANEFGLAACMLVGSVRFLLMLAVCFFVVYALRHLQGAQMFAWLTNSSDLFSVFMHEVSKAAWTCAAPTGRSCRTSGLNSSDLVWQC